MAKTIGPSLPTSCTSTSTRRASTPSNATVTTRAATAPSPLQQGTKHEPPRNAILIYIRPQP